jgi:(p)ppGpp synthase/HD superfamily hydrolase
MKSSPVWSQDRYIHAYLFAAQAHNGQLFKGFNLPYIVHVSLVSMEMIAALSVEQVGDPDLAIRCAILHDVIEDCQITFSEIEKEFGTTVANGVQALSKKKILCKKRQLTDSLERILQQTPEIWMVKMADRITNLQPPPPDWTQVQIRAYWQGAQEIHTKLKNASPHLENRLARKIENYRRYIK